MCRQTPFLLQTGPHHQKLRERVPHRVDVLLGHRRRRRPEPRLHHSSQTPGYGQRKIPRRRLILQQRQFEYRSMTELSHYLRNLGPPRRQYLSPPEPNSTHPNQTPEHDQNSCHLSRRCCERRPQFALHLKRWQLLILIGHRQPHHQYLSPPEPNSTHPNQTPEHDQNQCR